VVLEWAEALELLPRVAAKKGRLMRKIIAAIALILATLPKVSSADEVSVQGGYVVASRFMEWSDAQRLTYVMGTVDGIRAAAVLDASGNRYQKTLKCFSGMNGNQILAITDKWLNNNPEQWNMAVNHVFISMMYKTCNL
jgi:hypothetical protein